MADDIDRSLLDRLQALRGTAATTTAREQRLAVDRAETPSREDALAARLKQLRLRDAARQDSSSVVRKTSIETGNSNGDGDDDEAEDALLRTDDDILEHLVGYEDDDGDDVDDEQVQALLRELSVEPPPTQSQDDDQQGPGQQPTSPPRLVKTTPPPQPKPNALHIPLEPSLPSLPPSLPPLPSGPRASSTDDMASRLAALRDSSSPSSATPPWTLPSVPSAQPSSAAGKGRLSSRYGYTDDDVDSWCTPSSAAGKGRLSSRYGYTDDDVDSWCTVCLEDATLRCLGCDHDPYCARCWREMHRGSYAAFDDRSHRAVQFTGRSEENKVAIGAS
ncbi:hypothetical protein L249_0705 [Ophiocordyceps polyrhachis-furcata BCC 54312]|uniref:Uncharacterized protein n=1 Tax=Ophiocordyceps polyrhachis-furcata BCC 54312 TaxID=1330021 RepID=A0A367LFQ8_9HYPO|nr:hypothetical protein L249_0705 [Ophiocordyceps polyrhachis-furcata BCC 54312]